MPEIKIERDAIPLQEGSEAWLLEQEKKRKERRANPAPEQKPEDMVAPGSDIYNVHTKRKHLANEVQWSFANYDGILKACASGRGNDIGVLPKVRNEPILVIGSGPTLDEALPTIKEWEGDVICSPSQASTLVKWGKDPKYIVALDPDETPEAMTVDTWEGRDSTLFVHPGVNPLLVSPYSFVRLADGSIHKKEHPDSWAGKMGFFRKMEPQTPFYGNAQKMGYSHIDRTIDAKSITMQISSIIGTEVVMLGCAANAQIFLASLLGYNPLYLVGVDFGFPGGKTRFTPWNWKDGKWVNAVPGPIDPERVVKTDSGVDSEEMHLFYKRNFMSAWRIERMQIFTVGHGTIIETPQVEWQTVLKQQGVMGGDIKGFQKKEMIRVSEAYLARQNTFIISYVGGGVQFTEFQNGVLGVPDYLVKLRKKGVQNLDFNGTLKGIKELAQAGCFKDEETAVVEGWGLEKPTKKQAVTVTQTKPWKTVKVKADVAAASAASDIRSDADIIAHTKVEEDGKSTTPTV